MINMVEGAVVRNPNELPLVFYLCITIIFLLVTVTVLPFSIFSVRLQGKGLLSRSLPDSPCWSALFQRRSAFIASHWHCCMDRMIQANVIAIPDGLLKRRRCGCLLLDKTGTITLGNRQAVAFYPQSVSVETLADAAHYFLV